MFFFFNSLLKSWPCVSFLDKFSVAICLHELKKKKRFLDFLHLLVLLLFSRVFVHKVQDIFILY